MEMGNVSKRQQPDQRVKKIEGNQHSVKIPHPNACFSWPLN